MLTLKSELHCSRRHETADSNCHKTVFSSNLQQWHNTVAGTVVKQKLGSRSLSADGMEITVPSTEKFCNLLSQRVHSGALLLLSWGI